MEQDFKRRFFAELLILGVLTPIFLAVFPKRSIYIDGLLGRLLILLPAPGAVVATGMAYSLVHLPEVGLALASAPAGIFWTFLDFRDRLLIPLGLSHALLASTYYY